MSLPVSFSPTHKNPRDHSRGFFSYKIYSVTTETWTVLVTCW